MRLYVGQLPESSDEILWRSWDDGQTWEFCTRPVGGTWSAPVQATSA